MPTKVFRLTAKQSKAHQHLIDNYDKAILFGGAKGGGKSFLLCLWAATWTRQLIEFFDIKDTKYPLAVGFIGRKRAVDFNDTTLETFKRIIPTDRYEIKTQEKEIIIDHTAKILYGGLDDQENIKKFNSAEFAFIALDQAEETMREDISVLQATLRLKYNNKRPPYKELYTANPAECWLKEDFILGARDKAIFIPALADDNPYLPENYKQTLRNAFSYDKALLQAYLEGDWDAFAYLEDALLNGRWIEKARAIDIYDEKDNPLKIISSDIATRHGQNQTVITYRKGHSFEEIDCYRGIPTTETKKLIKKKYEDKRADSIVIDSDGVGEGVGDMLKDDNTGYNEFRGGYAAKALDTRRFRNLRSQFYWILAKKFEQGLYSLKKIPQDVYEKLKKQLCSIKVKSSDGLGRFQIESKEDARARGIESPDIADSCMMSEYGYFLGQQSAIKAVRWR